jgi:hypothetical protein
MITAAGVPMSQCQHCPLLQGLVRLRYHLVRGGVILPVRPRRVRGSKFKEAEINKMLDLAQELLPKGVEDWSHLWIQFAAWDGYLSHEVFHPPWNGSASSKFWDRGG